MDPNNSLIKFMNAVYDVFDTPVTWFREKIVVPNQQKYPWYHQQFRRVPTIDECDYGDVICFTEANVQYHRDKLVDDEILTILRQRYEHCAVYYGDDKQEFCGHLWEAYEDASGAWFCKHGDTGPRSDVKEVFMKQKHRMVWERRHGSVGSGMKIPPGTVI